MQNSTKKKVDTILVWQKKNYFWVYKALYNIKLLLTAF